MSTLQQYPTVTVGGDLCGSMMGCPTTVDNTMLESAGRGGSWLRAQQELNFPACLDDGVDSSVPGDEYSFCSDDHKCNTVLTAEDRLLWAPRARKRSLAVQGTRTPASGNIEFAVAKRQKTAAKTWSALRTLCTLTSTRPFPTRLAAPTPSLPSVNRPLGRYASACAGAQRQLSGSLETDYRMLSTRGPFPARLVRPARPAAVRRGGCGRHRCTQVSYRESDATQVLVLKPSAELQVATKEAWAQFRGIVRRDGDSAERGRH
jgi:hypothetical protein